MIYKSIKNFLSFPTTLLLSLLIITSCQQSTNDVPKAYEVPELLDRSESIWHGNEWQKIQNDYSRFKSDVTNNQDPKAMLQLAHLFIGEARVTGEHGHYYPAALSTLDQLLGQEEIQDDLQFLALTTKAGVQLSLHEFKAALQTGNTAALMNPANAQIHGVLVDANVELGNYPKAVALSDKMISIKPDIRSYSRVSYLREIHGDVEGSIDAMTMAVKAGYPGTEETSWAMLTLAEMYGRYGDDEKSEKILKNILELRPNYPFAVGALGDIYHDRGDMILAEKYLEDAMGIIPEVGFYISMAHLKKEQGKTEEMNILVDEIMIMLQDDVDHGHNMNMEYADLYLTLLEDHEKALEYAQIEYSKRPMNIDVNLMMGKIKQAMGDDKKAQEFFAKAGITGSKNPELLSSLNKEPTMI